MPTNPRSKLTFVESRPYDDEELALAAKFDEEDLESDRQNGTLVTQEGLDEMGGLLGEALYDRKARNLERARAVLEKRRATKRG